MKILTADEIKKTECKCFELYSTEAELMLKAGTACYNEIVKKYGDSLKNSKVSVLCGNGKNAGDGFVIARLLYCYGADASIVICDKMPIIAEPAMYYEQALNSGVKSVSFTEKIPDCDYIVDCMFGIGFHGEPRSPFDKIFSAVNETGAVVISVDTPSGTDSTLGSVCTDCIKADFTIAISTLKYAHILPPANDYCGDTVVVDIGISDDCYEPCDTNTIEKTFVRSLFHRQNTNDNKGSRGTVLSLCGSYTMPGAAVFAAESAIRSGAGLVRVTVPKSAYPLVECHTCQPVFHPVCENKSGTFSADTAEEINDDLNRCDSIVMGCGVGINDDTEAFVRYVLKNANSPVILDADGINCVNRSIDILKDIKVPVVLTPHPGEMSRLVSKSVAEVQADRIGIAKNFAKSYGVVLVLKGANTVVTDGEKVFVNTTGNPAMAMGGSGDMLSGMIGAFVAQGVPSFDAAIAGVYIHGLCGDTAAAQISSRGITVFDMIDRLGALMSEFEQ